MIRLHRKWDLIVLGLLLAGAGGWLWYRSTPGCKVERLLDEMRRLGPTIAGHTGGRTGADAFNDLVAMGESAAPFLARHLDDADPHMADSHSALRAIGAPATRCLLPSLSSQDVKRRRRAAWVLGDIRTPTREAVPPLLQAVRDEDVLVRNLAARALARIDRPLAAERALASVLKDLASADPSARSYAVWALEEIGPATPAAQAALEEVRQGRPRRSTG